MHPHNPGPGAPQGYDPIIGQTIGNYVVRQKLGEGGMGSVYLAEHPAIGKKVALKILHAEFAANEEVVSRFFNEARAVNDIQHPNIVDIVDYGVLQGGPTGEQMVYFIMEFLPGISLSELIRREAPLAPERALAISLQVADALSASHAKGIIHRDLKPDNIMLIQRGRERDFVKLLDFGIAKLTGDQAGSRRTRTGIVMGTPAYMSPEQCEGRGNIDHRTDIYALGIVIYEMITGRVPFQGEGYGEVLVQHLTQMPAAPSTIRGLIPPHVEQVVMKALEKRPDARYPTMEEMMRALADPVGYVEAHGGIAGFRNAMLTPSQGPIGQPTTRLTPGPMGPGGPGSMMTGGMTPLTPVPGSVASMTPGHGTQAPTTLGASAGQVQPGGSGKKVGLFVGIGVAVAGIAAAVVLLAGGGGGGGDKGDDRGGGTAEVDKDKDKDTGGTTDPGGTIAAKGGDADKDQDKDKDKGSTSDTGATGGDPGGKTGDPGGKTGDPGGKTGDTGAAGTGAGTGATAGGADTVTPAKKETVKITIESSPGSALVFVGDEKDPRGKTPYSFDLEKGGAEVEVKLFLKGYKWEKRMVKPSGNQTLDIKLEKDKKTGGGGDKGGGGKTGGGGDKGGGGGGKDDDDILNPFKRKN